MSLIAAVIAIIILGSVVAKAWSHYERIQAEREFAELELRMKSPAGYADSPADWLERRAWVISRDHGQCVRCGGTAGLQVHHRIPRAKAWNHSVDNLELLCVYCHSAEHGTNRVPATVARNRARIRASTRKAKRVHHCSSCGGIIPRGSVYSAGRRNGRWCDGCLLDA